MVKENNWPLTIYNDDLLLGSACDYAPTQTRKVDVLELGIRIKKVCLATVCTLGTHRAGTPLSGFDKCETLRLEGLSSVEFYTYS